MPDHAVGRPGARVNVTSPKNVGKLQWRTVSSYGNLRYKTRFRLPYAYIRTQLLKFPVRKKPFSKIFFCAAAPLFSASPLKEATTLYGWKKYDDYRVNVRRSSRKAVRGQP